MKNKEIKINLNTKNVAIFVTILVILGGVLIINKNRFSENIDSTVYYAVFINNGQVYFGNLKENNKKEFVLSSVYYLQLENEGSDLQAQLSESRFSLVKMGSEIHGPTDELYINKSNILFYEKLRDDSKVVESIKQSKK